MESFEIEILKANLNRQLSIIANTSDIDLLKSWSIDLQKQFPEGQWRTVNGSKVFINNGKVIAGLDGFNGMIDDFFKERESVKPESIIIKGLSKEWSDVATKWLSKLPTTAHPTTVSNFAAYERLTGRNLDSRDKKTKYGVSLEQSRVILPKENVSEKMLNEMKEDGYYKGEEGKRLLELTKNINVDADYFDKPINVVAVNSTLFPTMESLTKQKKYVQDYYNKTKGKDYFINVEGEATFVHECGHVYDNRTNTSNKPEFTELWNKWQYEKGRPDVVLSKSEAFAEAFANYHVSQGKNLPKYIYDFFDKLSKQPEPQTRRISTRTKFK